MSLTSVLERHRILLCLGSGGVGKTTCSAALGLSAARLGRRTLVLTIDPARRLASAVGLDALDHVPRIVEEERFRSAGLDPVHIAFMVLDVKHTFDDLIGRLAPDSRTAARLRENRLYREIVTHLPGAHEYAAMEALCHLRDLGEYDLLVLDTPPSRSALDFLEAPRRVIQAVENPMLEWFVRASAAGTRGLGLVGAFVIQRLRRFVGADFLAELGAFLSEFYGLVMGFRQRAHEVGLLLRGPDLGFIVVTTPVPDVIDESIFLQSRLREWDQPVGGWIINRVCPSSAAPFPAQLESSLAALATEFSAEDAMKAAQALRSLWDQLDVLARDDAEGVARVQSLAAASPIVRIPLMAEDVHDLRGLARVAHYLTS